MNHKSPPVKLNFINGSDQFHVMVFKPNAESSRAASYLCSCDKCLCDYDTFEFPHLNCEQVS